MSKKIVVLLAIVYFSAYSSLVPASGPEYKPGELLVRFAPKDTGMQRSAKEKNDILSTLGLGTIKREYRIVPGLSLVKLPSGQKVEDALKTFSRTNGILYAEPDYKINLLSTFPNDPNFNQLWAMHNIGQTGGTCDADIDAPEAWGIHTGSQDIIVAVLDSGVDYNHPDLSDNMWVNESELNGIAGIDDDDNGYVDDIRGWDFADGDNEPKDYYFHGTHVAGIIGAVGNNNEGVAGVCWNVKIMNLKIFPNYGQEWFISGAIAAIEYGVENGAQVLSNSWGGGAYSQSLKDEIEAADANGVLFVAAAGNDYWNNNDTYPVYPASYDCENIVAVLSTDQYDAMSDFSNYGPSSVDLGAGGSDILSTFPTYMTDAMSYYGFSTDYETISGTSMATPYVAGACALVWSMNRTLSHLQVRDIILNSVDEIPDLNGLCVTGGRLNLYNAVLEAANRPEILSKIDDVNDGDSVLPGDYITYTISYANPLTDPNDPNYIGPLTDVQIIDYLPIEVDPNNPFAPNYEPASHTYTWDIGTLSPGESNSVTLTVIVNGLGEPLGTISNICFLDANEIGPVIAVEVTDVNCWNPGVI
jgi:subtilisin family serine protease